jgi:CRP/FNR family transcriptional regulator, dissimilatory nitrate respiration regulator
MNRTPDIRGLLSHLPLFQGLTAAELQRLAAGSSRRPLRRGEALFRQGDRPTGFYLVVFGRIALQARSAGGRQRVADIIGAGRSFGEAIMFLDKPYIVTAAALTDALVLHVSKEAVLAALDRDPRLARRIIALLSAKLHDALRDLDMYAHGSATRRFVAWLLRLAAADSGTATIVLPSAKKVIASKLNISAEHLSRLLGELSREGLLEVRGRTIAIADVGRLDEWSRRGEAAS